MPELTQTITYESSVKATLRNDALTISVAVAFPYGDGRTATETIEDVPDELCGKVAAVLAEVRQALEAQALAKAQRAASRAADIAERRGEL